MYSCEDLDPRPKRLLFSFEPYLGCLAETGGNVAPDAIRGVGRLLLALHPVRPGSLGRHEWDLEVACRGHQVRGEFLSGRQACRTSGEGIREKRVAVNEQLASSYFSRS